MQLILLRHGRTEANENNVINGRYDSPLSKNGIRELKEISNLYQGVKADFFFSNSLKRCRDTFDMLFDHKEPDGIMDEFLERDWGEYEGKRINASSKDMPIDLYDPGYGAERFEDFLDRILKGIRKLNGMGKDKTYLVSTNAGVIKALFMYFLKIDADKYQSIRIENGMSYIFNLSVGKDIKLKSYETLNRMPIFVFDEFRLSFVRHGESTYNKKNLCCGTSDPRLTKEGIEELNDKKSKYRYLEAERYYSSQMKRAIETFKVIFPENTLYRKYRELEEVYFNGLEGLPIDIKYAQLLFKKWSKGEKTEIESIDHVRKRIMQCISWIIDDCINSNVKSAAIFGHGLSMAVFDSTIKRYDTYDYIKYGILTNGGCRTLYLSNKNGAYIIKNEEVFN